MNSKVKAFVLSLVVTSSSFVFAAGDSGLSKSEDLLYKGINFAILLILLHVLARKPLAKAFKGLLTSEKTQWDQTHDNVTSSEKELKVFQDKLASLQKELEERKEQAIAAAKEEAQKIIEDAKATAEKIESQSTLQVEQRILQARKELQAELVEKAMGLAKVQVQKELSDSKKQKSSQQSTFESLQKLDQAI